MRTTQILFLIVGIVLLGACKNDKKSVTKIEMNTELQNSTIEETFLVGSWIDSSESALHFTLFEDGTARSDNMKTLLYKYWKLNGNKITFTIESVGNGTSSTDEITYVVEKLNENELVVSEGTQIFEYKKK